MTYASKRKRYGELIHCEPSRFLEELPNDDIQWIGGNQMSQEEKKEKGNAHLANIRSLLAL